MLTIDLGRVKGSHYTSNRILNLIVEEIAKVFIANKRAIICYYCDFISPIPHTKKNISQQEYRSILFTRLYERYVSVKKISNVNQQVVTIDGGNEEKYYVHFIFRDDDSQYIPIISKDLKDAYSK